MQIKNKKKIEELILDAEISVEDKLDQISVLIEDEPSEYDTFKNEDKVTVECSCNSETLVVNRFNWKSKDSNLEDIEFNFAIFVQGHYHSKPSFWKRLRYAYWHITTGKTYLDEITLSKDETYKLFKFFKKFFA